jgi:hypothetical protein
MAFTPLFDEAQAVQLAVALANVARKGAGGPKGARAAGVKLAWRVVDPAILQDIGGAQWWEWARTARIWLLLALRQKRGKRPGKPRSTKAQRPAFAKNDPRGAEAWEDDELREEVHVNRRREGGLRVAKIAVAINKALRRLRPLYALDNYAEHCEFRIYYDQIAPLDLAALGAALLLDERAGFHGKNKKFYTYRSRFGMCARPDCRKFLFYGPGSSGAGHEHCNSACANAHRQERHRHKKKAQKVSNLTGPKVRAGKVSQAAAADQGVKNQAAPKT